MIVPNLTPPRGGTVDHPIAYEEQAQGCLRQAEHRTGEDRQAALTEATVWARLAQAAATVYAADQAKKAAR